MKPARKPALKRARHEVAPPVVLPRRARLLLVEPDELTRWSISTYLRRWFEVEVAESGAAGAQLAAREAFAALIVSDQLPDEDSAKVQRIAGQRNPELAIVRTVTGTCEVDAGTRTLQVEKPFNLASLARLLGVPEDELAAGA